jgi:hypothetical protein
MYETIVSPDESFFQIPSTKTASGTTRNGISAHQKVDARESILPQEKRAMMRLSWLIRDIN